MGSSVDKVSNERHFPWAHLEGQWIQLFSNRYVQNTVELDWKCVRSNITIHKNSTNDGEDGTTDIYISRYAHLHNVESEPIERRWILTFPVVYDSTWQYISEYYIQDVPTNRQLYMRGHHLKKHSKMRCILYPTPVVNVQTIESLFFLPSDAKSLYVFVRPTLLSNTTKREEFDHIVADFQKDFNFTGYYNVLLPSYTADQCQI